MKQFCEVCKKPVCRKQSYKTLGVTCNNCMEGPLTSSTVAVYACYILLASQRFKYSKYHGFELHAIIYFTFNDTILLRNQG